ncbi:phosphotransferase [Paeniroseomonas aquatica]|uniref:Phosphotransferase n=1 Tax=Paeniroseomonas aquatica TaxID=373043 RepID=A0ABT8AEZ8_9PROT|nr:phosphotransferase [Paeniroseomonas aquatica]MDN3568397.1 phosphotransferase [Paeniroseomonas aquatica]
MLNAAEIAALVPHQGRMCLLDRALAWDAAGITCTTGRHRDAANPLRRDGLLPAICGLEFAFQAMALHGALSSGAPQPRGFISSLREVALDAERLDDIAEDLHIEAVALVAEPGGSIYRFEISAEGRSLLGGQAAVILAREAA